MNTPTITENDCELCHGRGLIRRVYHQHDEPCPNCTPKEPANDAGANCDLCHGRGWALVEKITTCPRCFQPLHRETWSHYGFEERRDYEAEITAAKLTINARLFYTGVHPEIDICQETTIWYIGDSPAGCWLADVAAAKKLLAEIRKGGDE